MKIKEAVGWHQLMKDAEPFRRSRIRDFLDLKRARKIRREEIAAWFRKKIWERFRLHEYLNRYIAIGIVMGIAYIGCAAMVTYISNGSLSAQAVMATMK